jgi:2-polyprenyl-3-methyl-5-hydroxy-6-metoxy-1,4-benzoquinol methylase
MKIQIPKELSPSKKKNYFCSVCNKNNKKNFYFRSIYKDGCFPNYTYNKCKFCRSIYLVESFSDFKLSKLHDKYYENWKNFSFNYLNSIKRTEKNRENEWYNYYKKKISKNIIKKKYSLDIGCGWGGCVSAFNKMGFNSYGIDPQSQCIVSAKKKFKECIFLNLTVNEILKKKKFHNFFSIVTMHDVLEHIANPQLIIRNISKLLRKGGHLFIKVPNSESLQIQLLKEYSWEVSSPFHRTLFSKKALNLLLKKNKFKVQEYFNDSNSWGWTRGISIKENISKQYVKLRKNKHFRKLDLSTDLLLENISKLYNKETVLFVNAKKI